MRVLLCTNLQYKTKYTQFIGNSISKDLEKINNIKWRNLIHNTGDNKLIVLLYYDRILERAKLMRIRGKRTRSQINDNKNKIMVMRINKIKTRISTIKTRTDSVVNYDIKEFIRCKEIQNCYWLLEKKR